MKKPNMGQYLIYLFAFSFAICQIQGLTVKLYKHFLWQGVSQDITMYENDTTCRDLPKDWFSRVSSIRTNGLCLVLYSEANCNGQDVVVYPGTPQGNISIFGFNSIVKSLQVCDNYTIENRKPILLHSEHEGWKLVNIMGCFNIEYKMISNIYEIETYGTCFRFYSTPHCFLNKLLESPMTDTFTEKKFPDIKTVRSIDRCPTKPLAENLGPTTKIYSNETTKILSKEIILIALSAMGLGILIVIMVGYCLHRKVRQKLYQQVAELKLKNENIIEEFKNGNPKAFDFISIENADIAYQATNLPYDAYTFEIPLNALEMDNRNTLGMGQFGIVIKANLVDVKKFPEPLEVAVKTVKPGSDSGYVKALLDECKLMMYLQTTNHQHIVNLIGTCTENLHKLEPYVILEYCSNGSLLQHLRLRRQSFVNFVVNDEVTFVDHKEKGGQKTIIDTKDFLKWSSQIADGMHYLSTKKVIHGDLATRNILLDKNFDAKISDFGLSRQLYQYSQYVKKNQAPLPWRWMAIESLQYLTFSTESDVWAFGVTIWEIFSLGKVPYPEFRWTEEFIQNLQGGYRLEKPKYATTKIYNLLLQCWSDQTENRPSFGNIREEFLTYLNRSREFCI